MAAARPCLLALPLLLSSACSDPAPQDAPTQSSSGGGHETEGTTGGGTHEGGTHGDSTASSGGDSTGPVATSSGGDTSGDTQTEGSSSEGSSTGGSAACAGVETCELDGCCGLGCNEDSDPDCGVWSDAVVLGDEPAFCSPRVELGIANTGDALVLQGCSFASDSDVWQIVRDAEDGWLPQSVVAPLSGLDPRNPTMAMNDDGQTLIGVSSVDGAQTRASVLRYTPQGGYEGLTHIPTSQRPDELAAAIDASGHGFVVWRIDDALWGIENDPSEGWQTPQRIDSLQAETEGFPTGAGPFLSAAMESGRGAVLWRAAYGVWATRFTAEAGWFPPQRLVDDEAGSDAATVALFDDGRVLAAWTAVVDLEEAIVRTSIWQPPNGWTDVVVVDTADTNAHYIQADRVADHIALGWEGDDRMIGASLDGEGVWSVGADLGTFWAGAFDASLAGSERGALVVWQGEDLYASQWSDGVWHPPVTLDDASAQSNPQVAMGGHFGLVVHSQGDTRVARTFEMGPDR